MIFLVVLQDCYCVGPPCRPYSRLNCKRKGMNPFHDPQGSVFYAVADHIRFLVAVDFAQSGWQLGFDTFGK